MTNEPDNTIGIRVMKKNPKPDAPHYEFRTIGEMFNALTPENIDRFLEDFDTGCRALVAIRESALAYVRIANKDIVVTNADMPIDTFTWIDD